MGRVTGIGGVFLRSPDPESLHAWYVEHLGLVPDAEGFVVMRWGGDQAGSTVWAPFAADTDYFGSRDQQAMINYRVDDLESLLGELRAKGVTVVDKTVDDPVNGRFGWIVDPDGNRVELWQPNDGL